MITLSLLKQMQTDNIGTIDTDMFHLEIDIDGQGTARNGLWILPRGGGVSRFSVNIQPVDIYVRHTDKNIAYKKAKEVLDYLKDSFSEICTLPNYPPIFTETYSNVKIEPTSSVEFLAKDENRKHIFVVSGEIRYEED